jgi:hypothetical protein
MISEIFYENLNKSNIEFFDELKIEFDKVLQSGWFVLGENVDKFEE